LLFAAYKDAGVGYHDPQIENLKNALLGVHSGLSKHEILPKNYQGVALYCEWEMDNGKWEILGNHFESIIQFEQLKSLIRDQSALITGPIRQEILSGYSNFRKFKRLKEKLSYFENR
jgi:hypothetical protein